MRLTHSEFEEKAKGRGIYVPNGPPVRKPIDMDRRDYNCYAYALGLPELGWVQPGALADKDAMAHKSGARNSEELIKRFEADGLVLMDLADADPANNHVIIAVIKPLEGFHVYRFNSDHSVTSKRGPWGIDELKGWSNMFRRAAAFPIIGAGNIKEADFLNEGDVFVGAFVVPKEGVSYDPRYRLDAASHYDPALEIKEEPIMDEDEPALFI